VHAVKQDRSDPTVKIKRLQQLSKLAV